MHGAGGAGGAGFAAHPGSRQPHVAFITPALTRGVSERSQRPAPALPGRWNVQPKQLAFCAHCAQHSEADTAYVSA